MSTKQKISLDDQWLFDGPDLVGVRNPRGKGESLFGLTAAQAAGVTRNGPSSAFPGQTVIQIGDSFAEKGSTITSLNYYQTDQNVIDVAARLCGQKIREIANEGISGETTTQVLARFEKYVVHNAAGIPDWVFVSCGLNDMYPSSGGVSVTQSAANIRAMYAIAKANGIRFIYEIQWAPSSAVLPYTGWTAAKFADQMLFREYILDWARSNPNIVILDGMAIGNDPASAVGDIRTALYSYNNSGADVGIHPSNVYTYYRGKALAAAINGLIPTFPSSTILLADNWTTNNLSTNLCDNPLFLTTTGGTNDGTFTGTVPAGVVMTKSGTPACVVGTASRSDGYGNDMTLVITPAAANNAVIVNFPTVSARLNNGETSWLECEITTSGCADTTLRTIGAFWNVNHSAANMARRSGIPSTASLAKALNEDNTYSIRTPPCLAPSSGTFLGAEGLLAFYFTAADAQAVTIKIGRVKFRRLAEPT